MLKLTDRIYSLEWASCMLSPEMSFGKHGVENIIAAMIQNPVGV